MEVSEMLMKDNLYGEEGNDKLYGGTGIDTLEASEKGN